MRILGRLVLWFVLLGLAYWAHQGISRWQGWQSNELTEIEHLYDNHRVYWLEDELNFKLPANTEQVRIMLTPAKSEVEAAFSVGFTALAQNGRQLQQGTRIYRQRPVSQPLERYFSKPGGLAAHFTQEFYIDGTGDEPLSALKLALLNADDIKVAVRVSVLERKQDSELAITWQRMHRDKRTKLLEGNVYPPDLVSEAHRRTALKFQWLPLGPEGIVEEDYRQTTLFIRRDEMVLREPVSEPSNTRMYADEHKVFTLVQNEEQVIDAIACEQPTLWLEVASVVDGKVVIQRSYDNMLVLPDKPVAEQGLYQVRAAAPCHIQATDIDGQSYVQTAKVLRSFIAASNQSLEFALTSQSRQVQPIRLDVRGLGLTQSVPVDWVVLDQMQNVLHQGQLLAEVSEDKHERMPRGEEKLLAKAETYIVAAANAAVLKVSSEQGQVLVNVFTRPYQLAYQDTLPKWFSVLPNNHQQLKVAGQSRVIHWQRRLPHSDADDTQQQWQLLATEPPVATFDLFSPNHSALSQSAGYQRVNGVSALLLAEPGEQRISPNLVYRRDSETPQKVTVHYQGRQLDYWLSAKNGRFTLPQSNTSESLLKISGPEQVRWYANHLAGVDSHRIRRVYKLRGSHHFLVEKTEAIEWITFHYYPALRQAHEIKVALSHETSLGEAQAHTVPVRTFAIPMSTEPADNHLLNQSDVSIWGPVVLKFPLEADLPQRKYRLQVSSNVENSGYIQASYVRKAADVLIKHYTEANHVR